ncbi:hypothetical protein DFH94DRAFT_636962 [Russula ochroleuca]|uniref:DUF8040 domain-containing protein n=1 Tax=Russula ochroleuca TaxID=152965 RepID=A0A9P5JZ63_9AGAM|nr:hypothetical protein DFH94DRAFT_636962 [Russula ochroleuca]
MFGECLAGHAEQFCRQMGMENFVFRRLLYDLQRRCGLHTTRHVSAEEQLAIFLQIARTGLCNSEMQE